MEFTDLSALAIYCILVLWIGIKASRGQTANDYLIHGRNLGGLSCAAATAASWIGGGMIVAFTAYVYQFGVAAVIVYVGIFLCMCLFGYLAPRIRQEAHLRDHLTLPDYFRWKVGGKAAVSMTAITVVMGFFSLMNQFIAGGSILASITSFSYESAVFMCAALVLIYLVLGGMRSVVKTDMFQLLAAFVLILLLGGVMTQKTGIAPELLDPASMPINYVIIFIVFGLIGPFANAEIWQRVFAARDDKVARRGLIGGGALILLLGCSVTLVGLAVKTAYPEIDPNDAAVYGIQQLLPAHMRGIILVFLFAAIMSSVDTVAFVLATALAKDIVSHIVPNQSSKDAIYRNARIAILFIIAISACGSLVFRNLVDIVITFSGISVGLIPPMLASFRWKLSDTVVATAIVSSIVYVIALLLVGDIDPQMAMLSLGVSGLVLLLGEIGRRFFDKK